MTAQNLKAHRDIFLVQGNLVHDISAAPTGISSLHQLPAPPPVFEGRDDELAELLAQLTADHAAGAAISGKTHGLQGMGGVGKTALALVLAHRLADRYPDTQLFLNLRGADPTQRAVLPAEAMRDVILAFRPDAGQLPEEVEKLAPIYRSILAEAGRVLLVLDNAADAAQVQPLLPPPNCLLLVTSRTHFKLPGLIVRDLDCLAPEKACALLVQLAPRVQGAESEAAALCGRLPLALEVFAGAINDKSLTPVPELLGRLRGGEEKLAPVDAAFAVSAGLLAPEVRAAWQLLAVFPASFDLRAAAAVWSPGFSRSEPPESGTPNETDAARDTMQALVNASLVEFNAGNGRVRLHDLVRQFCAGRLSETDRTAALLRHARHYGDVAQESNTLYKQRENVLGGLELFDRERTHLEAAFDWLQPRRDEESAALLLSLVDGVAYTGGMRFHPRQRIRWLEAQRDAARVARNRQAEGAALGNLGNPYKDLGDARKAIESCEQSLVIKREIGDRRGEGNSLGNLGNAYADLGDACKAIEFYERQLVIVREIGDRRGEGTALGNLGNAYAALGDARKAIEFHEQGLVIDREIGDRRGEGAAFGNLGNSYAALGDARKAIEYYEQQLVIAREIGDRRGEGNALWNSGDEFWKLGDRAHAIARAEAALKIFEEIESPHAAMVRAKLAKWRGE